MILEYVDLCYYYIRNQRIDKEYIPGNAYEQLWGGGNGSTTP
ncbi:hypothetical protein KDA_44520 [Dictyobacter alpinus]|uniref:Uncharacterized protein n=1 Tax=Dictyobacter alpinus TaxID=2014873 RepID=A0A402BC20_9CHLR|nr:hypothetical protein KDA_44520 [Dictyobacter alpinus]